MKHARSDYDRIVDPAGLIGADEPVFLIRAKDAVAAKAVRAWACLHLAENGDPEIARVAMAHADAIDAWQDEHGCEPADLPAPGPDPAPGPGAEGPEVDPMTWTVGELIDVVAAGESRAGWFEFEARTGPAAAPEPAVLLVVVGPNARQLDVELTDARDRLLAAAARPAPGV